MITACGSILGCSYAEGCRRKVRVLGTVLGGPKSRCADAGNCGEAVPVPMGPGPPWERRALGHGAACRSRLSR